MVSNDEWKKKTNLIWTQRVKLILTVSLSDWLSLFIVFVPLLFYPYPCRRFHLFCAIRLPVRPVLDNFFHCKHSAYHHIKQSTWSFWCVPLIFAWASFCSVIRQHYLSGALLYLPAHHDLRVAEEAEGGWRWGESETQQLSYHSSNHGLHYTPDNEAFKSNVPTCSWPRQ